MFALRWCTAMGVGSSFESPAKWHSAPWNGLFIVSKSSPVSGDCIKSCIRSIATFDLPDFDESFNELLLDENKSREMVLLSQPLLLWLVAVLLPPPLLGANDFNMALFDGFAWHEGAASAIVDTFSAKWAVSFLGVLHDDEQFFVYLSW